MISKGNHVKFVICIFTRWQVNYQFHSLSSPFFICWMYNKTIVRFGFCDIQNNQGLGEGYHFSLRLRPITPTSTLIILDITKTSSNNCLLPVIWKLLCLSRNYSIGHPPWNQENIASSIMSTHASGISVFWCGHRGFNRVFSLTLSMTMLFNSKRKGNVCTRIEFNSWRISWRHQHGHWDV